MPAVSVATPSWTLRMPQGTLQQWTFTFTEPGPAGVPYPISGATWEYVVRANAADTGVPLISITTALTSAGQITVTATASLSQVLLDIPPPRPRRWPRGRTRTRSGSIRPLVARLSGLKVPC